MANFKLAYQVGRVNEGGYSNHKADKGKETYSGVARAFWPNWKGWTIIDAVKKNRTIKTGEHIKNAELEGLLFNFYEDNFWKKIKGNDINDQKVANIFYDWTLTSGGAIKQVQKAFNQNADGVVGPKTIAAINTMSGKEAHELIKSVRANYYNNLVKADPDNAVFIKGWLNRTNSFVY